MYEEDEDFKKAFEACKTPASQDTSAWLDYMIQDGLLFKNNQLCIPNCSMRENLMKVKHIGGLGGHFEQEKNHELLRTHYYWPKLRSDVQKKLRGEKYISMSTEEPRTLDCYPISNSREALRFNKYGFDLGFPKT